MIIKHSLEYMIYIHCHRLHFIMNIYLYKNYANHAQNSRYDVHGVYTNECVNIFSLRIVPSQKA